MAATPHTIGYCTDVIYVLITYFIGNNYAVWVHLINKFFSSVKRRRNCSDNSKCGVLRPLNAAVRLLTEACRCCSLQARELHCFATADNGWLVARFAFRVVDLNTMEARTAAADYEFTQQFYVDARNLLHNTFVCYGGECLNHPTLLLLLLLLIGTRGENGGDQVRLSGSDLNF